MPDMRFVGDIGVCRPLSDVRAFFGDLQSLARWDWSVVRVVATGYGPLRRGEGRPAISPASHNRVTLTDTPAKVSYPLQLSGTK